MRWTRIIPALTFLRDMVLPLSVGIVLVVPVLLRRLRLVLVVDLLNPSANPVEEFILHCGHDEHPDQPDHDGEDWEGYGHGSVSKSLFHRSFPFQENWCYLDSSDFSTTSLWISLRIVSGSAETSSE